MSKGWAKQLAGDALDAIDLATTQSWWEYAIEVIPVAGDIYGGAKLTEQGVKVWKLVERFEGRAEAIVKGLAGGSAKLDKALGGKVGDMLDAHHLIPEQLLKENSVVQDAVAAGFDFTGKGNGLLVPTGTHGNHKNYTASIKAKLDDWAKAHKDYTPEQAKKFVESLAGKAKQTIEKNKGNVNNPVVK
jgi:hypothetical protein